MCITVFPHFLFRWTNWKWKIYLLMCNYRFGLLKVCLVFILVLNIIADNFTVLEQLKRI